MESNSGSSDVAEASRSAAIHSEAQQRADFSQIRYAQCWEDADILLAGLDIREGDVCLSIAAAGDNAIAMVSGAPARVIAIDLSPAQIACVDLRVAAYQCLEHEGLLALIGSIEHDDRMSLYRKCRSQMTEDSRRFWDAHTEAIVRGIGGAGKFERYFATFRTRIVPLIHNRDTVERLLVSRPLEERRVFYRDKWDNSRWRMLFKVFFSRPVMGRLGRDPAFFRYVKGSVSDRIFERTRYALIDLEPADNPYLQWILTGRHTTALPYALRPENFEAIRANIHRLEYRTGSLESYLDDLGPRSVDKFNLSDIFEYMSIENYEALLALLARTGRQGGRLVYWNMLADRHRPKTLAGRLRPLQEVSRPLFAQDKAFFYSDFVIEEVV